MPLRYGALQSLEESRSSKAPRRSMQAMCADLSRARASAAAAAAAASSQSPFDSPARHGDALLRADEAPPRWPRWWPIVDSGMLSSIFFLIAMTIYLASIRPYGCREASVDDAFPSGKGVGECLQEWQLAARLFLAAKLFFLVQSLIDFVWSLKRWRVQLRLVSAEIGSDVVDEIPWDFLSAAFLVVTCVFLLMSSLLDGYAMGDGNTWTWLIIGHHDSDGYYAVVDYPSFCCKLASVFVTFGAVLGVAGRCSYTAAALPDERLLVFQFWRISGMFDLNWAAWADMLFFLGAVLSIGVEYLPYNELAECIVDMLRTLDAIFYVVACWPTMRAMTRDVSAANEVAS